jgi:hypothetical protein
MNLELNDDQKMLLEMVKKFSRNQILRQAKKTGRKRGIPPGNHETTWKTWNIRFEGPYSIRWFWRKFI